MCGVAPQHSEAPIGPATGCGRERLATAAGLCRLASLLGALTIWAAWSSTVFWLLLGFALTAGLASMALARLAVKRGKNDRVAEELLDDARH